MGVAMNRLSRPADSEVHQQEPDAPEAPAHGVQGDQAGDEEVDVAGTGFLDVGISNGDRVGASGGSLQGVVDGEPGGDGFGAGGVVVVFHGVVGVTSRTRTDLAGLQIFDRLIEWPGRGLDAADAGAGPRKTISRRAARTLSRFGSWTLS